MTDQGEKDPYGQEAPENEGSERPQYHHDPQRGETRFPPESGYQGPAADDPHGRLNEPAGVEEDLA